MLVLQVTHVKFNGGLGTCRLGDVTRIVVSSCLVSAEEDAGAAEGVEEEEELVLVDVESFSCQCHRLLQLLVRATCLRLFTQALLQVATKTSIYF